MAPILSVVVIFGDVSGSAARSVVDFDLVIVCALSFGVIGYATGLEFIFREEDVLEDGVSLLWKFFGGAVSF